MTEVGVIGAGRMGQPIIGHLVRKGFRTQVYDVDAGKRASVEERGAQWAAGCISRYLLTQDLDRPEIRLTGLVTDMADIFSTLMTIVA